MGAELWLVTVPTIRLPEESRGEGWAAEGAGGGLDEDRSPDGRTTMKATAGNRRTARYCINMLPACHFGGISYLPIR